jgi:histone H3/H4
MPKAAPKVRVAPKTAMKPKSAVRKGTAKHPPPRTISRANFGALAQQAGVQRKSRAALALVAQVYKIFVRAAACRSLQYMEHNGRGTLFKKDLVAALDDFGLSVYE